MIQDVMILAGGTGTRLWPASKKSHPKQFLSIGKDTSLVRAAIDRALSLNVEGEILIITGKNHVEELIEHCKGINKGKEKIIIIPEPEGKNTAPAIALGCEYLKAQARGNSSVLMMPADHVITPQERLVEDAKKADTLAKAGYIVPFGIKPSHPETGFGYIHAGEKFQTGKLVKAFTEKPDEKRAEQFYKDGSYYWNSGLYAFTAEGYLAELAAHTPEVADAFSGLELKGKAESRGGVRVLPEEGLKQAYRDTPDISIDYAVAEKSKKVAMVEVSFSWNDVGSWDEVSRIYEGEGAEVYTEDAEGNFVLSDMPVALCGVDDVIVVVKNGAVLVCKKGESQKVKGIVNQLKEIDRKELL